jgi:hypothetical protein
MSEAKTYAGGCHCGAVRYQVKIDALESAVACNCSICQRSGSMLTFVPAGQFELKSGADALSDYQFGKKNIHHFFCKTCGIKSFARGLKPGGGEMVAINVRCLDGMDLSKIAVKSFDGASLPIG